MRNTERCLIKSFCHWNPLQFSIFGSGISITGANNKLEIPKFMLYQQNISRIYPHYNALDAPSYPQSTRLSNVLMLDKRSNLGEESNLEMSCKIFIWNPMFVLKTMSKSSHLVKSTFRRICTQSQQNTGVQQASISRFLTVKEPLSSSSSSSIFSR